MKGKNNIWKRWWLGLAYFNLVLPLYRNHPIDMLHKSVEWFLYNGSIGLNGKVDALLRSMFLFRYMFFFISNSTFHLCLISLQKNYDLSLKVVKKVLSIIFKFSMISAQYVPLKAFFIDFMMSFVNIVKLLFCLSGVIC